MTQDELIMACATVSGDLNDNVKTLSKTEATLASLDTKIARSELVEKTTLDALKHLLSQSIILMAEFKSLRLGLGVSRKALGDLREERLKVLTVRNKALAAIPALRRQLQKLEHQLDTYEPPAPPRTVLEFRRDK